VKFNDYMTRVEEKKNRKNESCLNFAHKLKFNNTFSGTPEPHNIPNYTGNTVDFASTLRSQEF
jgi:hypothetical protein